MNFYCKKNELTYIKEFNKIKKEYNLQRHIRSNSIIMCEAMITSDNDFFDKIGLEETGAKHQNIEDLKKKHLVWNMSIKENLRS